MQRVTPAMIVRLTGLGVPGQTANPDTAVLPQGLVKFRSGL